MSLVLGKNPSNELKEINLTNSGNLKIDLAGSSGGAIAANVDITGNTIGLSTSANQSTANSSLASLVSNNATETTLSSVDTSATNIDTNTTNIDTSCSTIASETTATAASASAIDGKLPASVGQKAMSASLAVVVASDQSSIPVSSAGGNTTNVADLLAPGAGNIALSTAVDMNGSTNLTIFGNSTNTTDTIEVLVSHDNSTYYTDPYHFVSTQPGASGTDFNVVISNSGARYYKIRQADTQTTAFTVIVNSSKK
jgi:hypothetical protein